MSTNALKVDTSLKNSKAVRQSASRTLSLSMIKKEAKGAPVASYLFPYFKSSGIPNDELARQLGFRSHSNMSMIRTGAARLPISKAPLLAEVLELPDPYEFGMLVAENNLPQDLAALKRMGVVVGKGERQLLDMISEYVPKGDMQDFKEKLEGLLKDGQLS